VVRVVALGRFFLPRTPLDAGIAQLSAKSTRFLDLVCC
jgi:hypothetical protein